MRRRCLAAGCTVLIRKGSYCINHIPYRDPLWRNVRPLILRRDDYRCRINGPLCTGTATTVDHIDGDPLNNAASNLRAACHPCNTQKGGVA